MKPTAKLTAIEAVKRRISRMVDAELDRLDREQSLAVLTWLAIDARRRGLAEEPDTSVLEDIDDADLVVADLHEVSASSESEFARQS